MKVSVPMTELANSDFKLVKLKNFGYDVGLQKQPDGNYLALALICTHANNPLSKTGNGYTCSLHGSRFDASGDVKRGPAERSLTKLPVQQLSDRLEIQLQEVKVG
jgi:Rieske Fe-S protein